MAQYSGIFTLSQASQAIKDNNWTGLPPQNVEFLVVAGGGGGARTNTSGDSEGGGGGGAGGLLAGFSGVTNSSITVTIGAGGAGATSSNTNGSVGQNSVFGSITACGGGGGSG